MSRSLSSNLSSLRIHACFALLLSAGVCAAQTIPLATLSAVKNSDADKAEQAYVAGARLLDRQDFSAAQTEFEKAAKLDPERRDYALAASLTREHRVSTLIQQAAKARLTNQPQQADMLLAEAKTIDPENELVVEHSSDAQSLSSPGTKKATITPGHDPVYAPPIRLQPNAGVQDLNLRGDAKTVITQAARSFGIKVVFDTSSTTSEPPSQIRYSVPAVPYAQAMKTLLQMAHMFSVPVDANTLFIARDSQENRQKFERQLEETIYVPGSTPEQLNELTNIVKNVFDVKQVAIGASSGTILVRAPEPTLNALNETLDDMIDNASEVMIELKLLNLDKSRIVNTGVSTPSSIGVFSVEQEAQSIVSANQSLVKELISSGAFVPGANAATNTITEALLLVLSGAVTDAKVASLVALAGNGLGLTGIYLGSGASINFDLASSDTRVLDDINVRVGDHQTTTMRVGEKYPITTATYSSGVSSATSSALSGVTINGVSASTLLNQYLGTAATQTVPQVQYEDLGITLKTTPTILRSGMVNMQIDMKIEALTGGSANNIPVLSSQVYTSSITVPDGASAVMFSNLSKTQSAAISGLPGLGDLPGFQETLANDDKDIDNSELVLVVTPHVVRHRKELMASRQIPFSSSLPQEY
jgi:general secretion pathway protein D